MNEHFLKDLKKELRGFPKEEKEEILHYYREYLSDSQGENLPSPKQIVYDLLQEEREDTNSLGNMGKIVLKLLKQSPEEALCQKSLKWHFLFLGAIIFLFHTFCGVMFAYGDDSWLIDPETGMAKSGFFLVLGILAVIILGFQYFMVKTKKLPVIHGKAMGSLLLILIFMWLSWGIALSFGNILWSLFAHYTDVTTMAFHNSQYWTSSQKLLHYILDFMFFYPMWWFYMTICGFTLLVPFHLSYFFLEKLKHK